MADFSSSPPRTQEGKKYIYISQNRENLCAVTFPRVTVTVDGGGGGGGGHRVDIDRRALVYLSLG